MSNTKKNNETRRNIIELGYRPTIDTIDRSRPPKGASGVHVKQLSKQKNDKR